MLALSGSRSGRLEGVAGSGNAGLAGRCTDVGIVPSVAEATIGVGAPDEFVVAGVPVDGVVPAVAEDGVVAVVTVESIGTGATEDVVIPQVT